MSLVNPWLFYSIKLFMPFILIHSRLSLNLSSIYIFHFLHMIISVNFLSFFLSLSLTISLTLSLSTFFSFSLPFPSTLTPQYMLIDSQICLYKFRIIMNFSIRTSSTRHAYNVWAVVKPAFFLFCSRFHLILLANPLLILNLTLYVIYVDRSFSFRFLWLFDISCQQILSYLPLCLSPISSGEEILRFTATILHLLFYKRKLQTIIF